MLKKHKWSSFLNQNPDFRVQWEKLPRTKATKKCPQEQSKMEEIKIEDDLIPSPVFDSEEDIFKQHFVPVIKIENSLNYEQEFYEEDDLQNVNIRIDFFDNFMTQDPRMEMEELNKLWFGTEFMFGNENENEDDSANQILREWKERSSKYDTSEYFLE